MPVFRNDINLELIRGVKAFLRLEGGIVRGRRKATISSRKGTKRNVAVKKNQVARLRKELSEAKEEIARLKNESSKSLSEEIPIFFLVGAPKSGTTWVTRLANKHPEVLCKGEGRFFGRHLRSDVLKDIDTNNIGQKLRPASLYNALAEDEYLRLWLERTTWTRHEDVEEQFALLTGEAVQLFLMTSLSKTDKRIVGDKTPLHDSAIVKEMHEIFPRAKVVHIIRDGRDVAVSYMHHHWNRGRSIQGEPQHRLDLTPEEQDKRERYRRNPEEFLESGESIFSERRIETFAREYAANVGSAHQYGSMLSGELYLELRYENLLKRPEEEATKLFRFLGVRDDEKVIRRCVSSASFEKQTGGRERGQEDSTSRVRKGIAGDWKNTFTERDKKVYKQHVGNLLVDLGYEQDESW